MKEAFELIIERLKLPQGVAKRYLDFKVAKAYGNAIEIVKQVAEECNNDFCEWKIDGVYLRCQHDTELVITCLEEEGYRYKYCPVCGKKIKVVE